MSKTEIILDQVRIERERQLKLWGNTFDDKNTRNDWITYVISYVGKLFNEKDTLDTDEKIGVLVKVAALAVAAAEALIRNGDFADTHYEGANATSTPSEG